MTAASAGFFEEVEHTADVAIRCGGPDLEGLFCNAALGMYHLMGIVSTPAGTGAKKTIALEAMDVESLLVDWLAELAFIAETTGLVFRKMTFSVLTHVRLEATLNGSRAAHLEKVIKAVTFHRLKVHRQADGYRTTIVFDV